MPWGEGPEGRSWGPLPGEGGDPSPGRAAGVGLLSSSWTGPQKTGIRDPGHMG